MDVPEDIPFNMAIGLILAKSQVVGERNMDEDLKPFSAQFDLAPGDKAIVSTAESMIDKDFTAVEILNPEAYAATFPDWEERFQKSYVLCQWNSEADQTGDIGWFARVKLIGVTEEHYSEIQSWVAEANFPESPPDWLNGYYNEYTDSLAEVSPGSVPVTPTCPECGARDIQLHAVHMHRLSAQAGKITRDGRTVYTARSDPSRDTVSEAHLHCMTCNAMGDLDDDEWELQFH